jgi:hypothetical protein
MRFGLGCLLGLVIVWVGSSQARADIPPPESCTAPGQPCDNAGPDASLHGVCAISTCTKLFRSPDGGMTPMSYPCNLCQGAGAGGSDGGIAGAGTGGAAWTDAGAPDASTPSRKSSGCVVVPEGPLGPLATPMASLWLVGSALFAARRRRPNRRGRSCRGAR